MKTVLTLLSMFACVSSAFAPFAPFAQEADKDVVSEASITLEDCKRIVREGVAYQPGIDVNGNAVAPADLQSPLGGIQIPDEIVIDFGLDFAGRYGFDGGGLHTATAGILTIEYDIALGALTVNGKPLNKADSRSAAKACAMMLKDAHGAQ